MTEARAVNRRRLYNGCPDSGLRAEQKDNERILTRFKRLDLRPCWFPAECKWMLFDGYVACSGFYDSLQDLEHWFKNETP